MIIARPILTEKITALQDRRQYAFEVAEKANKIEIAQAIEKRFKVTVLNVRTMVVKGKKKTQLTRGGRFQGRTRLWKKALVTLKEGDKIDYLENV
ncbi:MAG: 50S ribosomal protein L23 [Bacteroidota bacterium]|jgi:large subunit ribosomal protein L23